MTVALCRDAAQLRAQVAAWRAAGERIALVPTMGALHRGHLALLQAARAAAQRTIVSIFVNPTQFAPGEDFSAYPRDLDADRSAIGEVGADLVFAPEAAAMYPRGFATTLTVGGPALAGLEDRFRPSHFSGVATIVAKLFAQTQPDAAFFGEKDFQQLLVIARMAADLDLPVVVRGVPTVRDSDGLALSSRNVFLDVAERARAPALHRTLATCAGAIARGEPLEASLEAARKSVGEAGFAIDYLEARRADDLAPATDFTGLNGRLLVAARLGRTRLIDNVDIAGQDV